MASTAANSQAGATQTADHRAIHAALLRSSNGHAAASPSLSRFSNKFSTTSKDYPVFSPTYEEEASVRNPYTRLDQNLMRSWSRFMKISNGKSSELVESDTNKSVNRLSSLNNEQLSNTSSCLHHNLIIQTAPGAELLNASSSSTAGDSITCTVSNKCKKNIIQTKSRSFGGKVTPIDKQPSFLSQLKSKGPMLSWLHRGTKKKPNKSELSPNATESEDPSELMKKEWGVFSLEMLNNEVREANGKRNLALAEAAEMRSTMEELQKKLSSLESYRQELKMALEQENMERGRLISSKSKRMKQRSSSDSSEGDSMPVSHEAMVEDFLQIVSEVRISISHFCKALIGQIDATDCSLMEKLIRQNPKLNLDNNNSKSVLCHLEALLNQYLYQDFENCVFQKNGSPKVLDPHQNRLENFSAFISFRNMSWNDVLRKGAKYYREDFSLFCDQKMSSIVSVLNWWNPWPELLLQSFFVSAKWIWLLHLLAFSFNPPVMIFRVNENTSFDPLYMEDVLRDKRRRAESAAQVKLMVMPGFNVKDRIFRCKVVCKNGAL